MAGGRCVKECSHIFQNILQLKDLNGICISRSAYARSVCSGPLGAKISRTAWICGKIRVR